MTPGICDLDFKRVRVIVFDLGGVLIDIDFNRSLKIWAQASGQSQPLLKQRFEIDRAYREHEIGTLSFSQYAQHLRQRLTIQLDDATLLGGWNALLGGALPGAGQLLARCAQRYPCYLFSNTNASHYAQWSRHQAKVLDPLRGIFTSFELGLRKPDPQAFKEIAKRIGCAPQDILLFDDTQENINGARDLGLQAVNVNGPEKILEILF